MSSAISTRRLTPEDWQLYRRVRLAALKEAPYAFGSTYEGAVDAPERSWRERLADRTCFIAEVDGVVAGTISITDSAYSRAADITAMWVDPRFRRQGVGNTLLATALDWARAVGHEQVLLWVTEVNVAAQHLYSQSGFVRTGASQEVRPGELEHEMSLRL